MRLRPTEPAGAPDTRPGSSATAALRRARAGVVLAFAVHAAVAGTLGPRIPALKDQANVTAGELGIALTGYAVALFAGTRLTAALIRRYGSRGVIRTGTPFMCLALVGLALPRNLAALTTAFVALGVWSGLLDVANNAHAVGVERGYRRPIMSSIHGAWSAGTLVGSAGGAGAAALNVSPLVHFSLVAVALGAVSLWGLGGLLGRDAPEFLRVPVVPAADRPPRGPLRSGPVLVLGLVGFSSFLAEGAAIDWSAVYMRESLEAGSGVAGLAFMAFAGGMTACRLVADRIAARLGPVRVVRASGLTAAVAMSVGLILANPVAAIAAFAVLGISLGPVVPITFSAAGNTSIRGGDTALGWVVTMSYLGAILGPAVIGFTAEWASLPVALSIPAALGLVIAASGGGTKAGTLAG